jgi:hypothetical protein
MPFSHLPQKNLRRDVSHRVRVIPALIAISLLLISGCGHYFNPFAVLVVSPKDSAESSAVQATLAEFAKHRNLRRTPSYQSSSDSPELKQEKERTIYYISDRGFYFAVYAAPPECIAIQFIERARDWTPQSLASLEELRGTVMKISGDRVRLASAPSEWKTVKAKLGAYCTNKESLDPKREDKT